MRLLRHLQQAGYQLVCLDAGDLPDYVRQNPTITILEHAGEATVSPRRRTRLPSNGIVKLSQSRVGGPQ